MCRDAREEARDSSLLPPHGSLGLQLRSQAWVVNSLATQAV